MHGCGNTSSGRRPGKWAIRNRGVMSSHHREAVNSAALRFEFDRRFIHHLLRTLLLRVRPRPQAQLAPSWMRP